MNKNEQPAPSLRELLAKATPGPYFCVRIGTPEILHHVHGVACVGDYFVESDHKAGADEVDAQLIARLSPDVMEKALTSMERMDELATAEGWGTPLFISEYGDALRSLRAALSALNSTPTPQ